MRVVVEVYWVIVSAESQTRFCSDAAANCTAGINRQKLTGNGTLLGPYWDFTSFLNLKYPLYAEYG